MSDDGIRHSGRCLCGAARYVATGEPLWVAHCHCNSCRRSTGAPMTTFVGFPSDAFAVTDGLPAVYESSPGVRRKFCRRCGTPLSYEADRSPGEIHLYISTLDEPERFPPMLHVFYEESIGWLHLDDDIPYYATLKSEGAALTPEARARLKPKPVKPKLTKHTRTFKVKFGDGAEAD